MDASSHLGSAVHNEPHHSQWMCWGVLDPNTSQSPNPALLLQQCCQPSLGLPLLGQSPWQVTALLAKLEAGWIAARERWPRCLVCSQAPPPP